MAMRDGSSVLVYHEERKKMHPGKYGASVTPTRKRRTTRPGKFWTKPVAPET
jgi:hypothetical protein